MDFDLKELGATLAVGAYFLFGIEVISYLILGSNAFLTIEKSTRFTPRTLLALSVVICFSLGMLMEDVSDKFVDRDTEIQGFLMRPVPSGATDDEIKQVVLYGTDRKKVGPLALEMANRHLFCRFGGPHGAEVERAITEGAGRLWGTEEAYREAAAKRLYYHAKNVVYGKDTYYDELKKIQLRIDFSRSYLAISALFILVVSLLTAYKMFKLNARRRKNRGDLVRQEQAAKMRKLGERYTAIIALLVLSYILAAFAYRSEETQFDNRAYGYFSSMNAPQEKPANH